MNRRIATLIEIDAQGKFRTVFCGNPADMPVRWEHPETGNVVEVSAMQLAESGVPMDADTETEYECHYEG